MYPEEHKVHELEMKIGLLGKDVEQTDRLCEKLSESIAKIQELNVNIMQMITLHEQRHEQHEKVETDLKEDIKDLHDRIDQVERHISARIDALRNDLINHKQQDKGRVPEMLAEIDKYKWMILGAAIAIGWIIGHVDLQVLGTLFK
jgi:predicted  nucleic acid-binding Zn-ribbon protein